MCKCVWHVLLIHLLGFTVKYHNMYYYYLLYQISTNLLSHFNHLCFLFLLSNKFCAHWCFIAKCYWNRKLYCCMKFPLLLPVTASAAEHLSLIFRRARWLSRDSLYNLNRIFWRCKYLTLMALNFKHGLHLCTVFCAISGHHIYLCLH